MYRRSLWFCAILYIYTFMCMYIYRIICIWSGFSGCVHIHVCQRGYMCLQAISQHHMSFSIILHLIFESESLTQLGSLTIQLDRLTRNPPESFCFHPSSTGLLMHDTWPYNADLEGGRQGSSNGNPEEGTKIKELCCVLETPQSNTAPQTP